MKHFLIITLSFFSICLKAQIDSVYVTTDVVTAVSSIDYNRSHDMVIEFINQNNIKIQSQQDSKTKLIEVFTINEEMYQNYKKLLTRIGNVLSNKVNTINNFQKVNELHIELKYLKDKNASYNSMLLKMDDKSENYLSIWKEKKKIEESIFKKELELLSYTRKENIYTITLNLEVESTSPEKTGISFVNMPGFEYSILKIESPLHGISSSYYNGYFLKYLFTKGKSFTNIGVYKSSDTKSTDSTMYNELFIIGFGQDFYSRHFGRGSRKFFNLYSGYSIGGILANGKTSKTSMFYISPSIGLELFKNRYFLFDYKMNYFIPLANYKNLRGLSFNLSLNFVF